MVGRIKDHLDLLNDPEMVCYQYMAAVKDIEEHAGQGIYGLDKERERIHNLLCEKIGMSKDDTLKITNNLNKFENGSDLYFALKARKESLQEK